MVMDIDNAIITLSAGIIESLELEIRNNFYLYCKSFLDTIYYLLLLLK